MRRECAKGLATQKTREGAPRLSSVGRRAARPNPRHVPAFALVVQGLWAALLTLPRTVTATTDPSTGAVKHAYGNVYTQLLEYIIPADLVF